MYITRVNATKLQELNFILPIAAEWRRGRENGDQARIDCQKGFTMSLVRLTGTCTVNNWT